MSKKEERRWSDRWKALEVGPGEYALTAGLDRTIDLRGIAPDLGTTLLGWSAGQPITPSTPEAQTLAARLADIGAITMPEFMSIVLMGEDALCAHARHRALRHPRSSDLYRLRRSSHSP